MKGPSFFNNTWDAAVAHQLLFTLINEYMYKSIWVSYWRGKLKVPEGIDGLGSALYHLISEFLSYIEA